MQAVEVCQVWSEKGTIVANEWMTIWAEYHNTSNAVSIKKDGVLIAGPTACTEAPTDRSVEISYVGKSRFYNDDYFNGEIGELFVADEPIRNLTRVCKNVTHFPNWTLTSAVTCSTLQSSVWTPDVGLQYYRDQGISAVGRVEGWDLLAVDGSPETCSQTWRETSPWWRVDFGSPRLVVSFRVYGRTDFRQADLDGFQVHVGIQPSWELNPPCAVDVHISDPGVNASADPSVRRGAAWVEVLCEAEGRYFHIVLPGANRTLALCEVEVFGLSNEGSNAIGGILPNCTACIPGICLWNCCAHYGRSLAGLVAGQEVTGYVARRYIQRRRGVRILHGLLAGHIFTSLAKFRRM